MAPRQYQRHRPTDRSAARHPGGAVDAVRALRESEAQRREAEELARIGRWQWDISTDSLVWSSELCRVFGLAAADAPASLGAFLDMVHPDDRPIVEAAVDTIRHSDEPFETSCRFLTPTGATRWLRTRGRMTDDDAGGLLRMAAVCQDITDVKEAEERLTRRALHDPLTGLPNRALFLDRLAHGVRRLRRERHALAVLFVDLDRFKIVNDNLGHAAGDQVLSQVARRVESILRPGDTMARFGGDEFAILCENLAREEDAVAVANRVHEVLAPPLVVDGQPATASASIGIAFTGDADAAPEALLRDADAAMYKAKESGRNRHVVFDHVARARVVARARQADELRLAMERNELRVYYQPDMDLRTDSLAGVEALVRWAHPKRGLVGPADFIGVAEETGLVVELGAWVLGRAIRQAATWPVAPGRAGLMVSVNLSARQLTQANLIDTVWTALGDTGMAPERLCLEITESVLMNDVEMSIEALLGLKALGVRLAIDDFGTGYSSLSYLRRFPVDIVKIDRSFVAGLGIDPAADAIVAAVINLSHALGLTVTAEGVEREEQLLAIRALHCDRAQGFLWSRPMPFEELPSWQQQARPAAVSCEPLDLSGLLVERTQALRRTTDRPVVLQAPAKLGAAFADLAAVKNVLDHLLGNAVTYSTPDRPIVVSAAADRRWVRISITDFGVGMTAEQAARCFEQFWQAREPGTERAGGTGIGLYIVRSLVEAMGGHVGVKSAKAKGSTFTLALPRSARDVARPRPGDASMPGIGEVSTIREFMRQVGVPARRGT